MMRRWYPASACVMGLLIAAECLGAEPGSGGALRLTGEELYRAGHSRALDFDDAVTIEAWVKPRKMPPAGGRIVDKGTAGTMTGYMLDTFPGNSLRMIVRTTGYEGVITFAAALPTDRWSHVAGVFSAAEGWSRLYVDGKEVARKQTPSGKKIVNNRHPLCVGADHTGGNPFLGDMDRVTIYDRALTGAEVAALAADPDRRSLGLAGRVADWDFDKPVKGKFVSSAPGSIELSTARGQATGTARLIGEAPPPEGEWTLWYRRPAAKWIDAMPVGNGRLGAMVFGGVGRERLQLNEDTLWSGGPHCYDNPEAVKHL
ncbi:MAG: LamG domain-containing protein, partial [Planctomycetota bacterium]